MNANLILRMTQYRLDLVRFYQFQYCQEITTLLELMRSSKVISDFQIIKDVDTIIKIHINISTMIECLSNLNISS